jgi:hypothetical protein
MAENVCLRRFPIDEGVGMPPQPGNYRENQRHVSKAIAMAIYRLRGT